MINGQKIELTDSQYKEIINAIGDSDSEKENPFARRKGENFFAIQCNGVVYPYKDKGMEDDDKCFECANYCANEDLLKRRAFYEKVERNLWRFSMENGGSGKYSIYLDKQKNLVEYNYGEFGGFLSLGPTFVSYEVCTRAIKEVLIPLLAKENVDADTLFEWSTELS